MAINYQSKFKTLSNTCQACKTSNAYNIREFSPTWNDEFQNYENLTLTCPFCGVITIINLNIPEVEEMEIEVMEELAPPSEIEQRDHIRAIMWDVRPDLKKLNRQQYREEYISKNKDKIEQIRAKIKQNRSGVSV